MNDLGGRPIDITVEDFKNISLADIEVEESHYKWRCCSGGHTDSRLIKFLGVYFILVMVFIFCLFMLLNAKTCEDSTAYMALLTMLIGILIPSPR
jgi:hypothetical protein